MNPGLTRPLKVGDRVWSKRFGYGQVTYVNQGDLTKYPYVVQSIAVKNKENGDKEGTIIDIDGCKIFRSGDSMIILPQNDDL